MSQNNSFSRTFVCMILRPHSDPLTITQRTRFIFYISSNELEDGYIIKRPVSCSFHLAIIFLFPIVRPPQIISGLVSTMSNPFRLKIISQTLPISIFSLFWKVTQLLELAPTFLSLSSSSHIFTFPERSFPPTSHT